MVKELVRLLGISFILSGIFLYFYTSPKDDSVLQEENDLLNEQVIQLQTQLEQTEKELANLQTLTSEATVQQKEEVNDESHDEESDGTLTLIIEDGTTSKDVAQKLETAKIIEQAKTFNDYLKDQGLTTSIQIGEHHLDASMSIETISKIITTLPKDE